MCLKIGKYYKTWAKAAMPGKERYIKIIGFETRRPKRFSKDAKIYVYKVYIYQDLQSKLELTFEENCDFAKSLKEVTETEILLYANRPRT